MEVLDKDMDMKDDFMGRYNHDKILQLSNYDECINLRYVLIIHIQICRLKISLKDIIDSQYTDQVGYSLVKYTAGYLGC